MDEQMQDDQDEVTPEEQAENELARDEPAVVNGKKRPVKDRSVTYSHPVSPKSEAARAQALKKLKAAGRDH